MRKYSNKRHGISINDSVMRNAQISCVSIMLDLWSWNRLDLVSVYRNIAVRSEMWITRHALRQSGTARGEKREARRERRCGIIMIVFALRHSLLWFAGCTVTWLIEALRWQTTDSSNVLSKPVKHRKLFTETQKPSKLHMKEVFRNKCKLNCASYCTAV